MSKKKHKKNKNKKKQHSAPKVTPKVEVKAAEAEENLTPPEETDTAAPAETEEKIKPSDEVEAEAKEQADIDTPTEDAGKDETKREKKPRINPIVPIAYVLGVLALAVIVVLSFPLITARTVTVEVNSDYSADAIHDNSPLSALYTVDYSAVNTEKIGTYRNTMTFYGFVSCVQYIHVADTIPPQLTLAAVSAVQGDKIAAADFVSACSDASEVTYTFVGGEPDTSVVGEQRVTLRATDEYGNYTEEVVMLVVAPFNTAVEVQSLQRRVGETVAAFDFIKSVSAPEMCTVTYATEPDLSSEGVQEVTIIVEDVFGNLTELNTKLLLCTIPAELKFEYGTPVREITGAVLDGAGRFANRFRLTTPADLADVGEHEITVTSTLGSSTVKVKIEDTVAPVLTVQDVTVFVGDTPSTDALVADCRELSSVTYAIEQIPDTSAVGRYSVTVLAVDAHGNVGRGEAVISVIEDVVPPEIFGIKNITVTKGSTVSFRSGVSAVDNRDGDVVVQVDSSAVDVNTPGTYPVHYSATDASGNTTVLTVYLTVSAITTDTLNSLADGILQYIVTPEMTQREKAWAIYSWCVNNIRYSTRTSYLMGNFVEGAYSGFTQRSGNCYIYFAVASALLTRADIENLEVQRDDVNNPHYWNLVNVDGEWYHFDTCPHYAGHHLECFLLTDAQVREYSEKEVSGYYSFDSSLYPATP